MDEELKERLLLVNRGNSEACSKIIEDFRLLIYSILNKYELEYGDFLVSKEDLFQEGCIGLLEACKSYKENDETKFSTYAYVVIERKIQRAFFRMLKPYRVEYSFDKYEHLDYIESLTGNTVNDNQMDYLDRMDINDKLENSSYITDIDREIIKLRIQNYTYKEIAKQLNITAKKVDNRILRLKHIAKSFKGK